MKTNTRQAMRPAVVVSSDRKSDTRHIVWPHGKKFAFTIVDDTDQATIENVKPIYDLLEDLGMRTTKTVWPLRARKPRWNYGSLEDPNYLLWIQQLRAKGFEVAIHGASDQASRREEVKRALDFFEQVMGADPRMHINHVGQEELVYWYDQRFHGIARWLYRLANAFKSRQQTSSNLGHVPGSPYFWGDYCQQRIEYVRNLTFQDINTLSQDPFMPYHDPSRPYVNYWFSATEASTAQRFCDQLCDANQDRLVQEGGACILYTHFAFGYVEEGRVRQQIQERMKRLAALPGWFIPASELLDFLRTQDGWKQTREPLALQMMEFRWLMEKCKVGTK